jgi:hypothetical protein
MAPKFDDVLVLAAVAAGSAGAEAIRAWIEWVDHSDLTDRQIAGSLRRLSRAGFVRRGRLAPLRLTDLVRTRRPGLLVDLATVLLRK